MKQSLLIIGSKGMLGQALVKLFSADTQYDVMGWDRDDIDITDQKQLQEKIPTAHPTIIINATGFNAVDQTEQDEDAFMLAQKINGIAPGDLARIAKQQQAILVHFSTDYVFDGDKGSYFEMDQPHPKSRYAQTKYFGEQAVQQHGEKFYLIRTSKLFGVPASASGAKRSFFEIILEQAKQQSVLQVVDGERSCFTYVPDLAQATKTLIEGAYPYGIYHGVNEGGVTWYEGAVRLFALLGKEDIVIKPIAPATLKRPANRPRSSVLVNTKFPKFRSYEDALREWMKYQRLF